VKEEKTRGNETGKVILYNRKYDYMFDYREKNTRLQGIVFKKIPQYFF
jgi:hypothetical protein